MKDGVSVSRGSKEIPNYLLQSTFCQVIAYCWCFVFYPIGIFLAWWPEESNFFYGVIAVIFSCCTFGNAMQGPTSQYIHNTKEFGDCVETLSHSIQTPPAFRYIVQNYHTESRTTGTGKNRRTRTVRVNTRRCEMPFNYETWFDESDPISSIGILQMMKLTRLKVTKQIKMAPSVKERYDTETAEFLANNITDKY
jgi:hypothetical protein